MSNSSDTLRIQNNLIRCPACGTCLAHDAVTCDQCHYNLSSTPAHEDVPTLPLLRRPAVPPTKREHGETHPGSNTIILQFLPSGTCVAVQLERPLVLGRDYTDTGERFLSLREFKGDNHGVSRQHCSLRRQNPDVIVTDLDSTNGTLLNGHRLAPHEDYPVMHGDRLVLGSLHLIISFTD